MGWNKNGFLIGFVNEETIRSLPASVAWKWVLARSVGEGE
jgi:hypothetical protein